MADTATRFTTEGLVIKEMNVGESDRLVTLFTRDYGIIKAFAAGAENIKSKKNAATMLLTYSNFAIKQKNGTNRIYEATPIAQFFSLGSDIEVLTLSQYFCELAAAFGENGVPDNALLRLILNSLHFITKEKRFPPLIKAITEFRIATSMGYMPDLVACKGCGKFEEDIMLFNLSEGSLSCQECGDGNVGVEVDRTLLSALRHIAFSEFSKLYSFNIPEQSAKRLSEITSQYLTLQTDQRFKSLEFYNQLEQF